MATSPKRKITRAATLADVGRAAGVSAMAASAVLNGARTSSRTAPETRARILKAAERLRYRPNAAARALVERRMNTLGVAAVFQGNELNQYFLEIFNGVVEAAARHNQNTTVFTLHNWGEDAVRLPGFCDGRIDGLILVGPTLSKAGLRLLPDHAPSVAIHPNLVLPGSFNLETDEEEGAFEMVKYLVKLGHRRIMHICGPKGLKGPARRISGYRRALKASGINLDPSFEVQADFTEESGGRALRQWLLRSEGMPFPQAIFCANDALAAGCLEVLAELGVRVPADITVTGFDDTLAARSTVPQLTTVRQPLRRIGSRAVELLLERIDTLHGADANLPTQTIVFPTQLIVRASSAGPAENPRVIPALA